MRKFFGTILCVIGGLSALIMAILLGYKLYSTTPYGISGVDITDLLTLTGIFSVTLLLLFSGLILWRGRVERPDTVKMKKKEPTFAEKEQLLEWKRISEQEHVPSGGAYIWKYQGKSSGSKGFALTTGGLMALLIAAVIIFCLGIVITNSLVENAQTAMWVESFLILAMTAVIGLLALNAGQVANSKQFAFAREADGKLYLFNYRSPAFRKYGKMIRLHITGNSIAGGLLGSISLLINSMLTEKRMRRIDEGQVIENIMASGQVSPYGKQIVQVKSISSARGACRVYCTLLRDNGTSQHTSIVLSRSYRNFDALLQSLERLK